MIAYEQGSLCRLQGNFEGAIQWRQIALNEFNNLEPPFYQDHFIAMTHHALGNGHAELMQYNDARKHLRIALSRWEQLKNEPEQVSTWLSLGYLEWEAKKTKRAKRKARKYLQRALNICHRISDSAQREQLEQMIEETLAEIDNDPDG
jgi:tetratricopeptide (TPR) repeat protein